MTGYIKRYLYPALTACIVFLAVVLLLLLATASANTEFFDRYFTLLYKVNLVVGVLLLAMVGAMVVTMLLRRRRRKFGARLMTKLAFFFAVVGVLPGAIIYLVSLQFVSRSIESWFDIKVESALEAGLDLGRSTLDVYLSELQDKARVMAEQLAVEQSANTDAGLTLTLSRLRDQMGVQEATILTSNHRIIASASGNYAALMPDLPNAMMLRQAQLPRGYGVIEGGPESGDAPPSGNPDNRSTALEAAQSPYRFRVVVALTPTASNTGPLTASDFALNASSQTEDWYLQVTQVVPTHLAQNANAVLAAYGEYQEKRLSRTGLRKMYIGTLTLTLFLAVFVAVTLALLLGGQLAKPLLMLLQGTKEVAEGDLSPKRELRSNDELGMLTQQFNQMTRQLAEARLAVEQNRSALENSKAYLESILGNLTAGVFVFDPDFRLMMANPGAERIFKQPFGAHLQRPLREMAVLQPLSQQIYQAFTEHETSSAIGGASHWQKQLEVPMPGEDAPLILLMRGTRLPTARPQERGYVVVFDDISDVMAAQRSIAWGEVARRLAHEIKNPLTPIQLSAERMLMKLESKLDDPDANILRRSTTTIVNQVAAMQRMVDDFRDYARTPPVVLQALQLNDLVTDVLHLYGTDEAGGEQPINAKLAAHLPAILGDPTQLRQIIHNLLQNALDAVADNVASGRPPPCVTLTTEPVEYKTATSGTQQAVRLTIIDNGPGFAPRILTRAFEPYVTTKEKGTGLGLAMVKKIVDEHGARIELHNHVNYQDPTHLRYAPNVPALGAQISILFVRLAEKPADVISQIAV